MSSFKEFLKEQLLDEEFAEAYEQVSEEMDFALALAQRREELGLTQQALAQLTGIKQPMIARKIPAIEQRNCEFRIGGFEFAAFGECARGRERRAN